MIDPGLSRAATRSINRSLPSLSLEVAWDIFGFSEYPEKVVISFGSGYGTVDQ
jgi:hypothetical protein